MSLLSPSQVTGDIVALKRTNPRQLDAQGQTGPINPQKPKNSFGEMMLRALDGANNATQKSMSLEQQAITNPKSVDAHTVMIALSEANMAVSITKAVMDRVLRAYQTITTIR